MVLCMYIHVLYTRRQGMGLNPSNLETNTIIFQWFQLHCDRQAMSYLIYP